MPKTALLIVDVQNYFVNGHTEELPAKIAAYIEASQPDFCLFTQFVNTPDSNHARRLGWHKCSGPPDTDIRRELIPYVAQGRVFPKNTYSVFKQPEFCSFLRHHDITRILICGIDTDSCVLASAFDAFDLGYDFQVVQDLCLSHGGPPLDAAARSVINRSLQRPSPPT